MGYFYDAIAKAHISAHLRANLDEDASKPHTYDPLEEKNLLR